MKIMFLCHRVPFPPLSGSKVRAFNMIRHLSAQGHAVTVASLARSTEEVDGAQGLADYCSEMMIEMISGVTAWVRMVGQLPTPTPSSFGYFASPRLARRINKALRAGLYELCIVHSSSMAPYMLAAPTQSLRILDFCDMDSQKWRQYGHYKPFPWSLGYALEGIKLERAEMRLARQFHLCTCATQEELQTLRQLAPDATSDWFPNGVDSSLFHPVDSYDPLLIAFLGRMDYYPNQQAVEFFCREVLPRLQRRRPALRFEVIGANPPRSIRELARLSGVSVTGAVSDVRPYVARAALTVAPLTIARGTQNKVLESMAMGVPVLSSPIVSKGVDAIPGEHLLCASSSEEYVTLIEQILESPALRHKLAVAGRNRVLTHHSWTGAMARLDMLVNAALERRLHQRMIAAA